ncbi:MAG: hypothetical protein LC796_06065 [Acidobacteria bacterium]|nr:hypothetical protein [Acidobacteriota bacterium]MCA1610100.1 hypothetical protein [Acidobacteriota bacterium]
MDTTSKPPETYSLGQKMPGEAQFGSGAPASSVLGPDGEAAKVEKGAAELLNAAGDRGRELGQKAEEAWSGITSSVDEFVTTQPMRGALTAFGVGVVVGVILGVTITRD